MKYLNAHLFKSPSRIRQKQRKAMLVYQAGIANVFMVDCLNLASFGRNAKRIYQGYFNQAHSVAYGLGLGGVVVRTAACNMAGDIAECKWSEDLDAQPFSEHFRIAHFN